VDNVEVSNVLLAVDDNASTAHVTATGDHNNIASIKLNEAGDFVLRKVELDGVINLNQRVGVTDGATIVCHDVRDTLSTKGDLLDLA